MDRLTTPDGVVFVETCWFDVLVRDGLVERVEGPRVTGRSGRSWAALDAHIRGGRDRCPWCQARHRT